MKKQPFFENTALVHIMLHFMDSKCADPPRLKLVLSRTASRQGLSHYREAARIYQAIGHASGFTKLHKKRCYDRGPTATAYKRKNGNGNQGLRMLGHSMAAHPISIFT